MIVIYYDDYYIIMMIYSYHKKKKEGNSVVKALRNYKLAFEVKMVWMQTQPPGWRTQ